MLEVLNERIVMYIPAQYADIADEFTRQAAEIAGGATRQEGIGVWYNGKGEQISETVNIIEVYAYRASALMDTVREAMGKLFERGEEAVAYNLYGTLYVETTE